MPRNPFLDQVSAQDFTSVSYYLQSKLNVPVVSSSFASSSISASYASSSTSASYAFNATSASYALTASYAMNGGGASFPYTGSARITGSLGVTGSVSILSGSLNVTNTSGTSILDTPNYSLNDSTGLTTVSWNNGLLRYNGNTSVDWGNRILEDSIGNPSVDWERRQAIDSASGLSIDWENRTLLDSIGNTILDWQNRTFDGTSSLATLTTSASYTVGSNNVNYPIAVFNGPINVDDSGSFIVGSVGRPLYFNPGFGILTTNTFSGSLTGTASFATTASYALSGGSGGAAFPYTGSAIITGSLVVTGSIRGQVIDITPNNQTASLNCALGNMFTLTLSSSVNTVLTASNIQPGQAINLRIVQPNPSGSLSYGSQFKFSSGFAYTASTTSSVTDIVSFLTFDSASLFGTSIRNFV